MVTKPNVLFVLSSAKQGWYLPEFAHPVEILGPHCDITVASTLGGEAPLDQSSVETFKDDKVSMKFYEEQKNLWQSTKKLDEIQGNVDKYDAIFYVGGYGPMFDIIDSKASKAVIGEFASKKKLLTGICHGPAAFVTANAPGTDKSILDGHKVTGVSQKECDILLPQTGIIEPWSVEEELNRVTGGKYEKADEPFTQGRVVRSVGPTGQVIITGQNPAAGMELGKTIYKELFGKEYAN